MTNKLNTFLNILKIEFTPIKLFSIIIIAIALVRNLSSPITQIPTETNSLGFLIKAFFLFCGIFGLMGNGKTSAIRAIVIAIPYMYLFVLYLITFILTDNIQTLSPISMHLFIGIWLSLFGAKYEPRHPDFSIGNLAGIDTKSLN